MAVVCKGLGRNGSLPCFVHAENILHHSNLFHQNHSDAQSFQGEIFEVIPNEILWTGAQMYY